MLDCYSEIEIELPWNGPTNEWDQEISFCKFCNPASLWFAASLSSTWPEFWWRHLHFFLFDNFSFSFCVSFEFLRADLLLRWCLTRALSWSTDRLQISKSRFYTRQLKSTEGFWETYCSKYSGDPKSDHSKTGRFWRLVFKWSIY